jgi:hypothetical protein
MPSEMKKENVLPCRHGVTDAQIEGLRQLLQTLPAVAPELLSKRDLPAAGYDDLLRATVERMRGANAATMEDKRQFIKVVLDYGVERGVFVSWRWEGTGNRQDYRVELPDGTVVGIEAKGCPDGNNTTIWDRPGWAQEFIVWCLCPESLAKDPGVGVWSGIAVRLLPKMAAERERGRVDALVFWDGRCGSSLRRCPKGHGVEGHRLRAQATDIPGQEGRDWLPPPCIYLFPVAPPHTRNNPRPRSHTVGSCKFADAMLDLFNVPAAERSSYVHVAAVQARGTASGTEIQVDVVSRCWPDGRERRIESRWKKLGRE